MSLLHSFTLRCSLFLFQVSLTTQARLFPFVGFPPIHTVMSCLSLVYVYTKMFYARGECRVHLLKTEVLIKTHTHSRTTCWNRWTGKGTPTKSLSTYCFAINICQQRWSYYIKWNLQWLFCECFGSPAGCKPQRSKVTLCCNSSGFELGIYRGISIVHICFCVCFGRH